MLSIKGCGSKRLSKIVWPCATLSPKPQCARLVQDDLRRQVVGRSAQRVRALPGGQALGKAKVRELDVPVRVQQQVLRLRAGALVCGGIRLAHLTKPSVQAEMHTAELGYSLVNPAFCTCAA